MTSFSSVVVGLQDKSHTLHDLDRAGAVYAIHQSAVSLRELAKALNCSPSLLGHLLAALQAPAADRALASEGKLSTRELVRRAKVVGTRRTVRHREALELERAKASLVGRRAICDWLAAENISESYGEQIIEEARRSLAVAEQARKLPHGAAPPDMTTAEIIQRCRPAEPKTAAITVVAWYDKWLALWAYYSMPETQVRLATLDLALEKLYKR